MIQRIRTLLLYIGRLVRSVLTILVVMYQKCISILLPPSCRFFPSCSNYALEVLYTQPLLKSLILITWRLLRCQPFGGSGFDPAPPPTDFLRHKHSLKCFDKKINSDLS